MSLIDQLQIIEGDLARDPGDSNAVAAIPELETELRKHLAITTKWIAAGLLTEPISYSLDHGNLVELEDRFNRLVHGLTSDPPSRESHEVLRHQAEELNRHHLHVAEIAEGLDSLRRRSYRRDRPLVRMAALRNLRRIAPRENRYVKEQIELEGPLAEWLESPDRDDRDKIQAASLFEVYRPQTRVLIKAESAARKAFKNAVRATTEIRLTSLWETLTPWSPEDPDGDSAHEEQLAEVERSIQEFLDTQDSNDAGEWPERLMEIQSRRSMISDHRARAIDERLARDELQRSLDERRGLKSIEAAYARARELCGDLGDELELRAQRRLEIEKSIRSRRLIGLMAIATVLIAGCSVLIVVAARHRQHENAIAELVSIGRIRLEEGRPREVQAMLAAATTSLPSITSDPRFIEMNAAAELQSAELSELRESLCQRFESMTGQAENDGSTAALTRTRITETVENIRFPDDPIITECITGAMLRIDEIETAWTEARRTRIENALQATRIALDEVVGRWPGDASDGAIRLDPGNWLATIDSLESADREIQSQLEDAEGFSDLQREAEALGQRITDRLETARGKATGLGAGLDAIRSASLPVRTEAQYLASMRNLYSDHARFLEEIGRFEEVETNLEIAETLVSLAEWRNQFFTDVITGDNAETTTADKKKALDRLGEFRRQFADSPLDTALERLGTFMRHDGINDEQTGDHLASALRSLKIADLRRVATSTGWIYARPNPSNGRLYFLETVGDLTEPFMNLATTLPDGQTMMMRPVRSEASAILEDGIAKLSALTGIEAAAFLLDLIDRTGECADPDPHLKLVIIEACWDLWLNGFSALAAKESEAATDWLRRLRRDNRPVLSTDWISTATTRRERSGSARDARILVDSSPPAGSLLENASSERTRISEALQPTIIVGMTQPSNDPTTPRDVLWLDDVVIGAGLLVPLPSSGGVALVRVELDPTGRVIPPDNMPRGAVPVFRTRNPQ
ncbi:hypothetical protein OAG01_01300 [bacterium]|nr:hypothetical protein [bacterium]